MVCATYFLRSKTPGIDIVRFSFPPYVYFSLLGQWKCVKENGCCILLRNMKKKIMLSISPTTYVTTLKAMKNRLKMVELWLILKCIRTAELNICLSVFFMDPSSHLYLNYNCYTRRRLLVKCFRNSPKTTYWLFPQKSLLLKRTASLQMFRLTVKHNHPCFINSFLYKAMTAHPSNIVLYAQSIFGNLSFDTNDLIYKWKIK